MSKAKADSEKNAIIVYLEDKHRLRVQSQFSESIPLDDANALYQAFVEDTIAACLTVESTLIIAYTSDRAREIIATAIANLRGSLKGKARARLENGDVQMLPQPESDVTANFEAAFRKCFESGHDKALLIDCVTPTLSKRMLENAFKVLKKKDIVFGPTLEGSYYLLGMRKIVPPVFNQIDWSNADEIYSRMVEVAQADELNWEEIELWYDLRQPGDLEFLVRDINAFRIGGDENSAKATEAILETLFQKLGGEEL